jgi:hypothetical protein
MCPILKLLAEVRRCLPCRTHHILGLCESFLAHMCWCFRKRLADIYKAELDPFLGYARASR